jgi:uncharacterized protein YaiE (UPF0345 family)
MKKRITKIIGVVLSLALLSSLAMVTPVIAQPGENEWAEIDLPPIAQDTDVELLAQAVDGTLFASVVDTTGPTWTLYRSEPGADGVAGWEWEATEFTGYGQITAISPAPNWGDNDTVYVAAAGQVYRCTSAGDDTPILLRQIVDSATLEATIVYDMDLWTDGDSMWIMVGTDIDVLVMEDALFAEWIDMDLTISFDGAHLSQDGTPMSTFTPNDGIVLAHGSALFVAFAPDFNQSGLIWAIVGDDAGNMWVAATISPGQWGQVVNSVQVTTGGLFGDGELAFADYYSSTTAPILYAAFDDNAGVEGDLYLIEGGLDTDSSVANPLLVDGGDIDFRSVQVSDQVIMGGEADTTNVWISQNGGDTFNDAAKPPTGDSDTQVLMAPGAFDPDEGIAYAATTGVDSAFSYTVDGGNTWNQTNFVDTLIDEIETLAFDPMAASQPGFMITDDGATDESLWRSPDLTAEDPLWERVFSTTIAPAGIDDFDLVEYAMDGSAVLLYGDDNDEFWKSTDNGQIFTHWRLVPAAMLDVNGFILYDSATLFAVCENGFYGTTRFGPAKQRLDGETLVSVALQPGYDMNDPDNMTVITGSDNGEIFVSEDGGGTWGAAQVVATQPSDVWVAFDANFNIADSAGEGLIYFASDVDDDVGIAEIDDVDGTAENLEDANGDSTNHGAAFAGLFVSPGAEVDGGNALYAICVGTPGHLERLLLHEDDNVWEMSAEDADLEDPVGLWGTTDSNVLWTIDSDDAELWALEDTLAGMVTGVVVSDETISSADVEWDAMTGAEWYEVCWDDSEDWIDDTEGTIVGLSDDTEYEVRVRVATQYADDPSNGIDPGDSPWSSRWSIAVTFYTLEYVATPFNLVPYNGMQDAPLLPSFVWGESNGESYVDLSNAEYFEFQLSTDPAVDEDGFISGIIAGTPAEIDYPTMAYTQTEELAYDTNHYWIVRAVSDDSLSGEMAYSDWCFSNFHTRVEEIPPVTIEPAPTPTIELPQPTVAVTVVPPDVNVELPPPQVTVVPPDIVVDVPAVVTVTQNPVPTIQMPPEEDPGTPVYIWIIVAIGAVLTIAVIVLLIRNRRVVYPLI